MLELENLTSTTLDDKEIAMDALTASKANITGLTHAITELSCPELRHLLAAHLNSAINDHFKLSDLAISKGWYPAFQTPKEQLDGAVDYANSQLAPETNAMGSSTPAEKFQASQERELLFK